MPIEDSYHHDEADHHMAPKAACVLYTFAGTALNARHDRMCGTAKHYEYNEIWSEETACCMQAGRLAYACMQTFCCDFATQRRMLTSSKASYWLGTGSEEHGAL